MRSTFLVTAACSASILLTLAGRAAGQSPMSQAAPGNWLMAGTQEVVGWFAFDPSPVKDRVPEFVRFVTVGELANAGVQWAVDYLTRHTAHAEWGVSFLEIARADTFSIDGREPTWPEAGAAAVWFARVIPKDGTDLGSGLPLQILEFWIPDSQYVAFMRQRGYYAAYADVRLSQRESRWVGSITGADFGIRVACTPTGAESGGPNSRGSQILVPPRAANLTTVIDIEFAGHRERPCSEPSSWTMDGRHPLTAAFAIESASFQYGYRLRGIPKSRNPKTLKPNDHMQQSRSPDRGTRAMR